MSNLGKIVRFQTLGIIIIMVLMTSLCCKPKEKKSNIVQEDLIGTWEHQDYSGILTFNEDRTFEEEFVVLRKPELGKISVKGVWSLNGSNLKYIITYSSNKEVLSDNIVIVDEIISITDAEFTYLAAPDKKRVTIIRK